jgi:hypothetical protein
MVRSVPVSTGRWRQQRLWLTGWGAFALLAAGALIAEVRVYLPPVLCVVATPAQAAALNLANGRVDSWAHRAEVLAIAAVLAAGGGMVVAPEGRRWMFALCLAVAIVLGVGAAGYASHAAARGCGI